MTKTILAAAAMLTALTAQADGQLRGLDFDRILGDQVAAVNTGFEHLFGDNPANRILVKIEYYGIQRDGLPNRKSRWFWMQARIAKQSPMRMRSEGTAYEVNIVPYTYSYNRVPESVSQYQRTPDEMESHHQFATLNLAKDEAAGIGQIIKVEAYTYRLASQEDTVPFFNLAFSALGYSMERQPRSDGGKEQTHHFLPIASLEGGVSFRFVNTPRLIVQFDLIRAGVSARVPLQYDDSDPSRFVGGHAATGVTAVVRTKKRQPLIQVDFRAGVSGETGMFKRRDAYGNKLEDEIEPIRGRGYLNSTLTYYF